MTRAKSPWSVTFFWTVCVVLGLGLGDPGVEWAGVASTDPPGGDKADSPSAAVAAPDRDGDREADLGAKLCSAGRPQAVAAGVESPLGAAVIEVTPGGPAAVAGLRRGDLVVEFGGQEIQTAEDLEALLQRSTPGGRQRIAVIRGTERLDVEATLGSRVRATPSWYEHPEGNFRFRVPVGWKVERTQETDLPPERQYDRVASSEGDYALDCFRLGSDAAIPEAALEEFLQACRKENPDAQSGRFKVAGEPAVWVAHGAGEERRVVLYRVSFVHGKRRYVVNASAPPLSDPERLPLPLEQVFSSIAFRPRETSETGRGATVGDPSPSPGATETPSPDALPADVAVLLTPFTRTVQPSANPQTIRCNPRLQITLPGGLLTREEKLTVVAVPEAKVPRDPGLDFQTLACWDIRLGERHEFDPPLEVEVPYDPAMLNPEAPQGEQIFAVRWDDATRRWRMLPVHVDESRRTVTVRANHLSILRIFTIRVPGLDWLTWKKLLIAPGVAVLGHGAYEKIHFDVHLSPRCLVLYEKKTIQGGAQHNDSAWKQRGGGQEWVTLGPRHTSRARWVENNWFHENAVHEGYRPGVPLFIQDLAHAVDVAYDQYRARGFKVPSVPIVVKVDSNYVKLFEASGTYEKLFDRIHISTPLCDTPERLRTTAAHETFHAVQHQDYWSHNMVSFSKYLWWLESGAEYAACRVAFPGARMAGQGKASGVNPRLFEQPLPATGEALGYDDLEYDRAFFLDYLVSQGASFLEMHKAVAAYGGHENAIFMPLDRALRAGTNAGLSDHYRGFVSHVLFSRTSPVAALAPDRRCVERNDSLPLPSGASSPPPLEHGFALRKEYSAKVWAVSVEPDPAHPTAPRNVSLESVVQSADAHLELYVLKENLRVDGLLKPRRVLVKQGDTCTLSVAPKDRIYVVAIDISEKEDAQATVRIRDASAELEIDPPSITDNSGRREFTFKATARRLGPQIQSVAYQWDFGDGSPSELERYQGTMSPEITFSRIHAFAREGKSTVSLELFDTTGGGKVLLARKTAEVSLGSAVSLVLDPPITVTEPNVEVPFEVKTSKAPAKPLFVWTFSNPTKVVKTAVPRAGHTFDAEGESPITVELFDEADPKTVIAKTAGKAIVEKPAPETPELAALHKCKHVTVSLYIEKATREKTVSTGRGETARESLGLPARVGPIQWTGRSFRVTGTDKTQIDEPTVTIVGAFDEDLKKLVNLTLTLHGENWRKQRLQRKPGEWEEVTVGGKQDVSFNLHDVPIQRSQAGWFQGRVEGKAAGGLVTGLQCTSERKDLLFSISTKWHTFDWGEKSLLNVVFSEEPMKP